MAQAHVETADIENAIACYRRALILDPEAVEVHEALNEIFWEQGRLVLFPSHVFHGTIPFSSDEVRTTIAFDVMLA